MRSSENVVKSGITESVHRAPDVVGRRAPFEHFEQRRPERLRADGDAVDSAFSEERREPGVTVSGFASTVTSSAAGSCSRTNASASGSVNVGVPPPTNTVSTRA